MIKALRSRHLIAFLAFILLLGNAPFANAQVFIFDESEGFTNETTFVLDDDNAAGGSNLDIIANQGSDSDGTLRYNATTNQWEISNNGGAFNDLASVADIDLDQGYDNFGAAASTITVDAAEGQTGGLTFSGSLAGDETVSVTNSGAGGGLFVENTGAGDSFRVDDVASDTSPFVIDDDGNVGIGAATPSALIDVVGPLAGGNGLHVMAGEVDGVDFIAHFEDADSSIQALYIDAIGNIGLNNTTPAHILDIEVPGESLELGDATASDIIINFNDDDGDQNFGWDDSAEGFSTFGENLNVLGLDVDATSITIDADNTGAGANVDIIAEQGTDSDGTLRYNAAANVWELSNDGGAFNEITTSVTENTLDEAYDQGGAGAGRTITVDSGAVALSGTGFLLSLGNGAAADSVITFNDGVSRNFGWDDSEGSLSTFGQNLEVLGLEVDDTLITIDADNAGAGANVDIVAEQGTDSNGTLRYDATDNRWESSNDGGTFYAIANAGVFNAYDSDGGVEVTTTQAAVDLDTTRAEANDSLYSIASNVVTINQDGLYKLTGWVTIESFDTTGAQRNSLQVRFQEDVGGGFVNVPGTLCQDYMREQGVAISSASCAVTYIRSYDSGDEVQLTHQMNSAVNTNRTVADASGMTIELIRTE